MPGTYAAVKDVDKPLFGGNVAYAAEIGEGVVLRQSHGIEGEFIAVEMDGEDVFEVDSAVSLENLFDGVDPHENFTVATKVDIENSFIDRAKVVLNYVGGVAEYMFDEIGSVTAEIVDNALSDASELLDRVKLWWRDFTGRKPGEEQLAELLDGVKHGQVKYEVCPAGRWVCAEENQSTEQIIVETPYSGPEIINPFGSNSIWVSVDRKEYPKTIFKLLEYLSAVSSHVTDSGVDLDEPASTYGEIWDKSGRIQLSGASKQGQRLVNAWSTVLSYQEAMVRANQEGNGNYQIFFDKKNEEGLRWYVVAGLPRPLPAGAAVTQIGGARILSEEQARDLLGIEN